MGGNWYTLPVSDAYLNCLHRALKVTSAMVAVTAAAEIMRSDTIAALTMSVLCLCRYRSEIGNAVGCGVKTFLPHDAFQF